MLPYELIHILANRTRDAEERSDRVYEAVIGLVVDNKDPEKLGRIKVSFPTIPGDDSSHWAPMCAIGAGKERGWFFLPELDDEVVVMFNHGRIDQPVIVGTLWNGKDKPPMTNDGSNERRTIVSRSGSYIEFDDDAGTVTLTDGAGIGKIVISTENKITIEASEGDLCVQAPSGELSIVANKITGKGQQNGLIDCSSGLNIGGDAKVNYKGGMSAKVECTSTDLNPGGVSAPGEASASPEDVADPV